MASLNYEKAGVNRQAADRLVGQIAKMARPLKSKDVVSSVGGFASLYRLDPNRFLASSTDGVGTKLKLAFETGRHDTVGVDLVAMSVNDLLCVGAKPLFFLDYFATGKLKTSVAAKVISGVVKGCEQAGCSLIGGETAEMPGLYSKGEYDLAGFAVGSVDRKHVLPSRNIRPGDRLIGIGSSGFHSNGYSLLRKVLSRSRPSDRKKWSRRLLEPTRIYVSSVYPLMKKGLVKGASHVTGSGFLNLPRMSDRVSYEVRLPNSQQAPAAIRWLRETKTVSLKEMVQTFNMGYGFVLIVAPEKVSSVLRMLRSRGEKAWDIGAVRSRGRGGCQIILEDKWAKTEPAQTIRLNY